MSDNMIGTLLGVGVYHRGKYVCWFEGKHTKEYALWSSMLARCYDQKLQSRCPSYIGCSVSENFKNFQYFAEWCNGQVGFGNDGWHLDKDLLFAGNKVYSEDTCVFVPKELNFIILDNKASRGNYPIGVTYYPQRGKFRSYMNKYGKRCFFRVL